MIRLHPKYYHLATRDTIMLVLIKQYVLCCVYRHPSSNFGTFVTEWNNLLSCYIKWTYYICIYIISVWLMLFFWLYLCACTVLSTLEHCFYVIFCTIEILFIIIIIIIFWVDFHSVISNMFIVLLLQDLIN